MRRLRVVQALRGVAVLLVVGAHLSAPHGIEAHYLDGPRLTRWMHFPAALGVDLFFVISGVIITTTSWGAFGTPRAARRFAYRRVTRIYPLYLVVTALVLIVFLARPGLVNSHSPHRPEIVPSLLILPQPGDPLLAVGWTLVYELYFYAIFTVALCFARRRLPWILAGWAALTVVLHLVVGPTRNPTLYVLSNLLNLEFALGACVGLLVAHGRLVAPRALLAASGAGLAVVLGVLMATAPADFPSLAFRVFALGVPIAVVVYAAIGLELRGRALLPGRLERVGDASYSIYLWHVPILATAGLVVERVGTGSLVPHVLVLVALLALAVAGGERLYALIERPLLRAFGTRRLGAPGARRPVAEADITPLAHDAVT